LRGKWHQSFAGEAFCQANGTEKYFCYAFARQTTCPIVFLAHLHRKLIEKVFFVGICPAHKPKMTLHDFLHPRWCAIISRSVVVAKTNKNQNSTALKTLVC